MTKKTQQVTELYAEGKSTDVNEEMERLFLKQIISNMGYLVALLKKYPDMLEQYLDEAKDIEYLIERQAKKTPTKTETTTVYTFNVKDPYGQCKSKMISKKQAEKEVIKVHKKGKTKMVSEGTHGNNSY